jgi:hypothetical protein
MNRIHPLSARLSSRSTFRRLFGLGSGGCGVIGWLGALGCGQAGLVEPEVPVHESRLLSPPASVRAHGEVLHASVEIFGLRIANLDSSLCRAANGSATMATEVEAAPLVQAIRKTSGEAKTELSGVMPASSDYTFRDGDIVRHYQVDYRTGGYAYVYDNGGVERRTGVDGIPEGAEPHDMHSSMMLLRAWRPRLDETAYFYVVLGRRPWRVDMTSRGPEMIKLGDDPRLTYRLDGVAVRLGDNPEKIPPKHFSLWLSEDTDRVPLRMVADASFGQVTMTLTGRESGARDCAPAAPARVRAPLRAGQAGMHRAGEHAGLIGTAWSTPPPRE